MSNPLAQASFEARRARLRMARAELLNLFIKNCREEFVTIPPGNNTIVKNYALLCATSSPSDTAI